MTAGVKPPLHPVPDQATRLRFVRHRLSRVLCYVRQCCLCQRQVKHKPPRQCWRAAIFHVVQSRQAEIVVMAAIIANCLVMAMTHADMDTSWEDFMTWANLGFTAFFTVEILAKVVALGIKPVLRVRQACGGANLLSGAVYLHAVLLAIACTLVSLVLPPSGSYLVSGALHFTSLQCYTLHRETLYTLLHHSWCWCFCAAGHLVQV